MFQSRFSGLKRDKERGQDTSFSLTFQNHTPVLHRAGREDGTYFHVVALWLFVVINVSEDYEVVMDVLSFHFI